MEEKITYIYKLVDPREPEVVRYVGKADKPKKRLNQHIAAAKRKDNNRYVTNWVASLLSCGIVPILIVLEEIRFTDNETWAYREKYWIKLYKDLGHSLANLTDGGEGTYGWVPTQETRNKIAEKAMGREVTEETRLKMSISRAGRIFTDEMRENISKALMGHEVTEITRQRIGDSKRGKSIVVNLTDEQRKAIGDRNRGKKMPEEVKIKISKTKKENPRVVTDEIREALSKAHKGRKHSVEHVEKVAAACRGKKRTPEQIANMLEGKRLGRLRREEEQNKNNE